MGRGRGWGSPGRLPDAIAHAARRLLFVAALALAASLVLSCRSSARDNKTPAAVVATDPYPVGPVSHEGRWLTDAAGRVLLLHGVNMVSKGAPYYPAAAGFGDDDAAWLADNGFDVVRLGVMATALMPQPGKVDAAYLDHLDETVTTLAKQHILVLLDFHQDGWGESLGSDGFPEWMTLTHGAENTHTDFPLYYVTNPAIQAAFQSLWDNAPGPAGVPLQDQFDAMTAALARKFAASPNILGYDFINEPWPGTTWEPCGAEADGCPQLDHSELDPFYAGADRAVRSADPHHLVFGEPFVLTNFGNSRTNIALPGGDPASGMSFHVYPLTPDGVPRVLANATAWAKQTGGALLETEWGATHDGAVITQQAQQFDDTLMPWIFWTYDEEIVKSMTTAPAGANLVASTVSALVRPHPLAIAGTPTTVAYDPTTKALKLSWSTTSPAGLTLPAGTVSSIEMPKGVYTNGYTVEIIGGKVTSAPDAPILTVTANAAASSVTLTVSPRSP